MRIVVLGDSISFPRRSKCQKLSESWPFVLGRQLGTESVVFRSKGGATSKEVADEASELASYLDAEFDLAIVQVGIVDACPRPYPRWLYLLASRVRGLGWLLGCMTSNYKTALRIWNRPWVSVENYEKNMERICSESLKFANLIVLIDPLPPGPGLIRKTGDFSHKLEEYRLALRRTSEKFGSSRVEVVAIGDICVAESMNFEELLLDDGHHLSVNGHLRLASALKSFVSTWQDSRK